MFTFPAELQDQIYQRIYDSPFVRSGGSNSFLSALLANENVTQIMGEVGIELKKFAEVADLSHPAIQDIISPDVSETLWEFLEIGDFSVASKFEKALCHFPKTIKRICGSNKFVNIARQYCRTIQDPDKRFQVRSQKQSKPIDLSIACAKGESLWHSLPDNFAMYIRNSKDYECIIAQVREKAERYKRLGCDSLYQEIKRSIDEFEEVFCQNYYGFHRLKMTDAAIILAKLHGFDFDKNGIGISEFGLTNKQEESKERFLYEPVIFPIIWINDSLPQSILKVIKFLEAFPEAGNKPIFDHYVCILPNVKGRSSEMSQGGVFLPILLGERDGKCYFISYYY